MSVIRKLANARNFSPDVIITHSPADSHNDHREAHNLMKSAFRESVLLGYGIVNSLVESNFKPRFFVDTSAFQKRKANALKEHKMV